MAGSKMKKTLFIAVLLAGVFSVLFGAAYWGQRVGIRSSTKIEAAYIPIVTKSRDCYEISDWDCVRVSQDIMAGLLATRLKVLKDNSLIDESVSDSVDEYLSWYKSNVEER